MAQPPNKPRDYEVGRGKPPKHTRWKPRQSGNPAGKRKGTKNLKTDFEEVIRELVPITVDGRVVQVPKQRLLLMALVNKGIKGDTKAAMAALSLAERYLGIGDNAGAEQLPSASDEALVEGFLARYARAKKSQADE